MKKTLTTGLLLVLVALGARAQLSMGGKPMGTGLPGDLVEWVNLEEVRVDALLLEDEWTALTGRKSQRMAEEVQLSLTPEQAGTWEEYRDGTLVWRLGIRGSGAKALGIRFSRYVLEPGVRIFIYQPSGKMVLGAFGSHNNKVSGGLTTGYLAGDELILQMEIPPDCNSYGQLKVGSVSWAYLPVFDLGNRKESWQYLSGPCNVDINCPLGDDWQVVKNSVVRIYNFSENCSGVLVNNTRQDGKAYVYTAAHCVFDLNKYKDPIFYFNFEKQVCNDTIVPVPNSISGATLLATGDTLENERDADSLDFALLELSVAPPDSFKPYFAGWYRGADPAQHTTAIHHPSGDVKKISVDLDPPGTDLHDPAYWDRDGLIPGSFWRILEWDVATTEGGSSGCPLFSQDQLVVGTLSGGLANCAKSVNDYFTRMDYAWDYYPEPARQLKHWLDPDNTGVMSLGGMDGPPVNFASPEEDRQAIHLYPNPASSHLSIEAGLTAGRETEIRVFHITGQERFVQTLTWEGRAILDVRELPPGLYILRIRQGNRLASRRFVITR